MMSTGRNHLLSAGMFMFILAFALNSEVFVGHRGLQPQSCVYFQTYYIFILFLHIFFQMNFLRS